MNGAVAIPHGPAIDYYEWASEHYGKERVDEFVAQRREFVGYEPRPDSVTMRDWMEELGHILKHQHNLVLASRIEQDEITDPVEKKETIKYLQEVIGNSRRDQLNAIRYLREYKGQTPIEEGADWQPVELSAYLRGEQSAVVPEQLTRVDGVKLLYPNKVHWFSGEPGSMKSWLALIAVAEQLCDGAVAFYLDFEDGPEAIVQRLLALGCSADDIKDRLVYLHPTGPMDAAGVKALRQTLECCPDISVIDGVNEAMGSSGYDSNSSKEFYQWWSQLGALVSEWTAGPVVVVDHVVKDKENRGRSAAGTFQKLAKTHVHIGFDIDSVFGKGMTGRAKLTLHKDKPGQLQPNAPGKRLGTLVLHSDALTGQVLYGIEAPAAPTTNGFRPTYLMEKASRLVELAGDKPMSKNAIADSLASKRVSVLAAVDKLQEEGFLRHTPKGYVSVRPYRESTDTAIESTELQLRQAVQPSQDLAI